MIVWRISAEPGALGLAVFSETPEAKANKATRLAKAEAEGWPNADAESEDGEAEEPEEHQEHQEHEALGLQIAGFVGEDASLFAVAAAIRDLLGAAA